MVAKRRLKKQGLVSAVHWVEIVDLTESASDNPTVTMMTATRDLFNRR